MGLPTTADMIKAGQSFKRPGQRKWRTASKVIQFTPEETARLGPEILVCLDDCSQIEFMATDPVVFAENFVEVQEDGSVKLRYRKGLK